MLLLNTIPPRKSRTLSTNFNTSYVVIKPVLVNVITMNINNFNTSYVVIKPFETCAYTARYVNFNTSYVVIKRGSSVYTLHYRNISIHLMLLLNKNHIENVYNHFEISIHLMLLLNFIFCIKILTKQYFNTSYVVIKPYKYSRYSAFKIISIHLMLLLNFINFRRRKAKQIFQYILCCY